MHETDLRRICRELGVRLQDQTKPDGWIEGHCPLAPWRHPKGFDRNPSFGVKAEPEGISAFHCWTCKAHGRLSSLARMLAHYSGDETHAQQIEADQADLKVMPELTDFESLVPQQEPDPEPLEEAVYDGLFVNAWDVGEARAYLRSRGIGETTARELPILYDDEERRVLFEVRDGDANLYGFTGRAIDDTTKVKVRDYAGLPKKHLILGQHRWYRGKPVLLVEGLFAYAHMIEIGIEDYANVGAVMGSFMNAYKARRLIDFGEPVYLLFDMDSAGDDGLFGPADGHGRRDMTQGAVGMLQDELPVMVPQYPQDKADPDYLTHGEVYAMLQDTPLYGAEAVSDLPPFE